MTTPSTRTTRTEGTAGNMQTPEARPEAAQEDPGAARRAHAEEQRLTVEARDGGVDAAAAAARRVIASLLRTGDGTDVDMEAVASKLGSLADHLDAHAPPLPDRLAEMWAGKGVNRHDPVTGSENAIAPLVPLVGKDDGSIGAVITLDLPYQGPPGCVHGGISALVLDHALGVANHWGGLSGMTAELTLRYHRKTPLFEPLTVTARQESVDGRKIRTSGSISAGGQTCVSAEALFIAMPPPGRKS